jgi:hypothetical protein
MVSFQRMPAALVAALVAIALCPVRGASAQTLVGVRAGAYLNQGDPFVGGEVLVGLDRNLFFNPNVEVIFADRSTKGAFNFDVHYDFARRGNAFFWVGGGLAVIYTNPEGSGRATTDAGADILFGVGFRGSRRWIPYVQAKVVAAGDSDFSLGFGIRF